MRCLTYCSASYDMQVELDGKPITLLKKGSYFGELALLRDMRRTASVRVVSETCDLFVLTKVGLQRQHSFSNTTCSILTTAWYADVAMHAAHDEVAQAILDLSYMTTMPGTLCIFCINKLLGTEITQL